MGFFLLVGVNMRHYDRSNSSYLLHFSPSRLPLGGFHLLGLLNRESVT